MTRLHVPKSKSKTGAARARPAGQGLETNRHCGRVVGASRPRCSDGQGQSTGSSHLEWYRTGLHCSAARKNTELCGDDHAPVTRGRMQAQYPLPHGPPKSTSKQRDGTPAKAKKTKGCSKQLTAMVQGCIKASTQHGLEHVCSPFKTVPANTERT